MNNKTMKAISVVTGLPILSGCATALTNKNISENNQNFDTLKDIRKQSERLTQQATTVSVLDEIWVAGKAFKMSDKQRLPSLFNQKANYSTLSPISLQEIINEISDMLNIRIILSSDAVKSLEEKIDDNEDFELNTDVENEIGLNTEEQSALPNQQQYLNEVNDNDDSSALINSLTTSNGGVPTSNPIPLSNANINEINKRIATGFDTAQITFSVEHSGTIKSLLDHIAQKTELFWKWKNNTVTFYKFEVKTFDIAPIINVAVESSIESDGESNFKYEYENSDTEQYREAVLDTIRTFISEEGQLNSNSISNTVTVRDYPDVVELIENYIDNFNKKMNRRIALKIDVFDIEISEKEGAAVDLNAIFSGSKRLAVGLNSTIGALTAGLGNTGTLGIDVIEAGNSFEGSGAILKSLATVGNVSKNISTTLHTINGQPVPYKDLVEEDIVESVSVTVSDDGTPTSSIEKDTKQSGTSLMLTPNIDEDGDISLNIVSLLSQLSEPEPFSVDDSGSQIQLVSRQVRETQQTVSLENGEGLLISSYQRKEASGSKTRLSNGAPIIAGGSNEGNLKDVVTLTIVTPYIMSK